MSNGAGNGELVQVLLNILGEMRTSREQHEARMAAHERLMAEWRAEHERRMGEHEQRMGEWAVIMLRINAGLQELEAKQEKAREDQRAIQQEARENAEIVRAHAGRINVLEGASKALVDAVRELTLHIQTVAVEVNALGRRVDAIEEGP
ncbi:MAG: hypothetical protein AAB434_10935 [Planctomycetota bacterium]